MFIFVNFFILPSCVASSSSGREDDNKLAKDLKGGKEKKRDKMKKEKELVNVANWVAAGRAPPTPNASELCRVIHHQHLDARQPRLLFSIRPAPELS